MIFDYKKFRRESDVYLKQSQYDWERDPRHLKISGTIPATRCLHCGRIFLNAQVGISYCRMCDKSMSLCKDGPDHDYDSWGNKVKIKDKTTNEIKTIVLTDRRDTRIPIEFDEEKFYFNKDKTVEPPHFTTAAGKIIPTEATEDADSDLYKMGLEK